MEESINKFVSFLQEIAEIEIKSENFRGQLSSIPNGVQQIFDCLDFDRKGEVTYHDICHHCADNNLYLQKDGRQFMGKYFQNYKKGLNYAQFCSILKPKTKLKVQTSERTSISIFTQMLKQILHSFKVLENLRLELVENQHFKHIILYIERNYESPSGFTKEVLREFIYDHQIYTKEKFALLSFFIFGEVGTFVEWTELFSDEATQPELQKEIITSIKQQITEQDIEIEPIPHNVFNNDLSRDDKSNLHQVLNQIEEMEKSIKESSKKKEDFQKIPTKTRNISFQAGFQEDFVHQALIENIPDFKMKVLTVDKNNAREETDKLARIIRSRSRAENENARYTTRETAHNNYVSVKSPICSPRESYNDFLTKKCYQRASGRNTSGINETKRTPSKAQLKIEELEMRDLSKFTNLPKALIVPKPHHIAYHSEFRNFENPSPNSNILKKVSTGDTLYTPIYSRNKVSKILYGMESGSKSRNLTPHAMRF